MKPSLCLNMIVRNEEARIGRCLQSVLPYVKAAVICDTGSTDDTKEIIRRACEDHKVPVLFSMAPFHDFGQARNEAWMTATEVNGKEVPWCNFGLLMDADMELVVTDPAAFDVLMANAPSYDMMQKGGAVSYANRRIVNLNIKKGIYTGVTHEYIDVPANGMIEGASFIDHADGSNRVEKYPRDAKLLNDALASDPTNGRYWYYLGNTYRDWGQYALAVDAYDRRIALGGWEEETHSAMMNRAGSLRSMGDLPGFTQGMIDAYNFRPRRAEPLYDLARYYREKGDNAAALLFAKAGVNIKRPNDLLFVNDFVYSHGLRYELSIAGFYSDADRNCAFQVTDDLALDPTCPAEIRYSARTNLYWHTQPLSRYCPSFKGKQLHFKAPAGYTAMNPSVEVCNEHISCNIRCVNYTMDEHGRYMIGEKQCGDAPIDTRNFVVKLDADMNVNHPRELLWHRPPPAWDMVTGLEDIRLWRYHGHQWFSATVREQNAGGVCQMIQGKLAFDVDPKFMHVTEWKIISGVEHHEKNWMPINERSLTPAYMHRLDTIIEPADGKTKNDVNLHVGDISGSSQVIPFNAGLLAVVHEASVDPTNGKRTYWHRFAWFEKDGYLRRLSLPFVFYDRQIEFCAGLAAHPNHKDLIISFGVRDAEAHVATVAIEEVSRMVWKFHEG